MEIGRAYARNDPSRTGFTPAESNSLHNKTAVCASACGCCRLRFSCAEELTVGSTETTTVLCCPGRGPYVVGTVRTCVPVVGSWPTC
jgi:hypothetical protein